MSFVEGKEILEWERCEFKGVRTGGGKGGGWTGENKVGRWIGGAKGGSWVSNWGLGGKGIGCGAAIGKAIWGWGTAGWKAVLWREERELERLKFERDEWRAKEIGEKELLRWCWKVKEALLCWCWKNGETIFRWDCKGEFGMLCWFISLERCEKEWLEEGVRRIEGTWDWETEGKMPRPGLLITWGWVEKGGGKVDICALSGAECIGKKNCNGETGG
jgi:hypothetical protein